MTSAKSETILAESSLQTNAATGYLPFSLLSDPEKSKEIILAASEEPRKNLLRKLSGLFEQISNLFPYYVFNARVIPNYPITFDKVDREFLEASYIKGLKATMIKDKLCTAEDLIATPKPQSKPKSKAWYHFFCCVENKKKGVELASHKLK